MENYKIYPFAAAEDIPESILNAIVEEYKAELLGT